MAKTIRVRRVANSSRSFNVTIDNVWAARVIMRDGVASVVRGYLSEEEKSLMLDLTSGRYPAMEVEVR